MKAYRSAFLAFCTWSRASGIADPFPSVPEAVAAYPGHLAGLGRKASTIAIVFAAILFAHRAADHEPPTNSEAARTSMKGIRRSLGTKATRKAPATAELLRQIVKKIPESLIGRRDRALRRPRRSG